MTQNYEFLRNVEHVLQAEMDQQTQLLPGDEVEFEGFVGNVVSVSTVNTLLESKEGKRLSIPNQDLLSSKFVVIKLGATKRTDNKT